jgi:hypothetical protein
MTVAYRSEPQLAACLLTRAHHSEPKPSNVAERRENRDIERDYRREVARVQWGWMVDFGGIEL